MTTSERMPRGSGDYVFLLEIELTGEHMECLYDRQDIVENLRKRGWIHKVTCIGPLRKIKKNRLKKQEKAARVS